jgi:hypothetical protein
MKTHILSWACLLVFILQTAAIHAAVPVALANQVLRTKGLFEDSANTAYRVQLMVAASDIRLENADVAASFQADARVMITVDSISAFEHIHDVVREIESSKWSPLKPQDFGIPRYFWRIVGAWENTVLSLVVDDVNPMIFCGGVWYRVDPLLIQKITRDFVALATGKLLKTEAAATLERK